MVQKERFKEWYAENKDRLAKQRKERYRKDPQYRENKIQASRRHYWLNKRRAAPMKPVEIDPSKLIPDEIADIIISNEDDIRCGLTVSVPMFYHGSMSKHLRRSVQTLRLWALKGLIPEATYRNHINYRLYTKDQLLLYLKHIHLLKLNVKDFSNHPFFVAIREELNELEPDGIKVMSVDEWRLGHTNCIWCGSQEGLEYFDEDKWKLAPCFNCFDPYDIESRKKTKESEVHGYCEFCSIPVSKKMHVVKNVAVLTCPNCRRRIPKVEIVG